MDRNRDPLVAAEPLREADVVGMAVGENERADIREVIHSLGEKLAPGGFLMLGHSESLINISTAFKLRHFKNDLVYQKPGKASP